MLHLRIVAPADRADRVMEVLCGVPGGGPRGAPAGRGAQARGDLILCDVAREDASVIIGDLKELGIPERRLDRRRADRQAISEVANAAEKAAPGCPPTP